MKEKIQYSDFKIKSHPNKQIPKLTPEGRQRVLDYYSKVFPEFLEKWGEHGIMSGNLNFNKIVRRTTLDKIQDVYLGWHSCYSPGKFQPYHFQLKDFTNYSIEEILYTTILIVG
jgi:hypothetical protein